MKKLASGLKTLGATPNQISILSIVFSFLALIGFIKSFDVSNSHLTRGLWLGLVVIGIQLRLICNLIDGMIAVEQGMKSPLGGIFNEAPDRITDTVILLGVTLAALGPYSIWWGVLAIWLSVMTAYFRLLGASLGTQQYFIGPMAKQHRMAVITLACFLEIFNSKMWAPGEIFYYALLLICAGAVVTCVRRLIKISQELKAKNA